MEMEQLKPELPSQEEVVLNESATDVSNSMV